MLFQKNYHIIFHSKLIQSDIIMKICQYLPFVSIILSVIQLISLFVFPLTRNSVVYVPYQHYATSSFEWMLHFVHVRSQSHQCKKWQLTHGEVIFLLQVKPLQDTAIYYFNVTRAVTILEVEDAYDRAFWSLTCIWQYIRQIFKQ